MTQSAQVHWSIAEKEVAKAAIKKAYRREIENLISDIRSKAGLISRLEDIWNLHDLLSTKRHDIEGKYDEREPFLLYTLSKLVKEGLIDSTELEGLEAEKRTKISLLTRM